MSTKNILGIKENSAVDRAEDKLLQYIA